MNTDINTVAATTFAPADIARLPRDAARKQFRAVFGTAAPRGASFGTAYLRGELLRAHAEATPAPAPETPTPTPEPVSYAPIRPVSDRRFVPGGTGGTPGATYGPTPEAAPALPFVAPVPAVEAPAPASPEANEGPPASFSEAGDPTDLIEATPAPKARKDGKREKNTGRPLVSAYLSENTGTIGEISAALGVHARTVRAAILYGQGAGSFNVVGYGGSKGTAKVWAFAAAA